MAAERLRNCSRSPASQWRKRIQTQVSLTSELSSPLGHSQLARCSPEALSAGGRRWGAPGWAPGCQDVASALARCPWPRCRICGRSGTHMHQKGRITPSLLLPCGIRKSSSAEMRALPSKEPNGAGAQLVADRCTFFSQHQMGDAQKDESFSSPEEANVPA